MTRPRDGFWPTSPVTQFLLAGLVVVSAVVTATVLLSRHAASDDALNDASATTSVLATSVAEPAIPRRLAAGDIGAVDRFDRVALRRLLVNDVRRIKIWNADGTIVYSDETRLIGQTYDLGDEELEILRDGGIEAEVTDLDRPENRFEPHDEGLVEVYTQVHSPEGEPLLFETYYSLDGIEQRGTEVMSPFLRIALGSLAVLAAVATLLLWLLNRRLGRAAAERERLLRLAAEASEAERRRIARDLHDGVVQDLAGTTFAVTALASRVPPEERADVDELADTLRRASRDLRSLLVEIHPPELSAATLPGSLQDLVAPAAAAGVEATVSVDPLPELPPGQTALLWRVAQEAVRNALRHAHCHHLDVRVRAAGGVVLEVEDDGTGFVPEEVGATHFGLRGLRSLVADRGGRLDVRTRPGEGTLVRLTLDESTARPAHDQEVPR